jgi:type IX secretion system substrate protein
MELILKQNKMLNSEICKTEMVKSRPGFTRTSGKKNYLLIATAFICLVGNAHAQAPGWLWAKSMGGTDYDIGSAIAIDASGDVYTTGAFTGTVDFDAYLIKTDANGNSGCNQGNPATITGAPVSQVTSPATIVSSTTTIVTIPDTIAGSGGIVTTLCTTLGIQEIISGNSFLISPNPSTGNFIITFADIINKGEVQIFNAYGAKVFNEDISHTSNAVINLKPGCRSGRNIPEGIYVAKEMDGEKQYCMKIIITQNY